jgi:HAD superfamily hydrolase (TIGR01548 family)
MNSGPNLEVDAILFDLDGTLVDESSSYREAIRMTAEFLLGEPITREDVSAIKQLPGFNNDWDATWGLVGARLRGEMVRPTPEDRLSEAFFRLQNVFQTYYLGDRLWHEISGQEPPFPWDEPLISRETPLVHPGTLQRLSIFALGIATSRPRAEALMATRQHGFDRYIGDALIVAAHDAPFDKPHPAPLQELARRLMCERPAYVGDSIDDALAAFAAGMPFIHVGTEDFGDPGVNRKVHRRVRCVDEIVDICMPAAPAGRGMHG